MSTPRKSRQKSTNPESQKRLQRYHNQKKREEAERQAEEELARQREEEAERQAEEQARQREEAERQAEEQARQREEAERQAQEQARKREEEAERQAQEQARQREEAERQAEEELARQRQKRINDRKKLSKGLLAARELFGPGDSNSKPNPNSWFPKKEHLEPRNLLADNRLAEREAVLRWQALRDKIAGEAALKAALKPNFGKFFTVKKTHDNMSQPNGHPNNQNNPAQPNPFSPSGHRNNNNAGQPNNNNTGQPNNNNNPAQPNPAGTGQPHNAPQPQYAAPVQPNNHNNAAQPGNGASFGSHPRMNGAGYMSPQQQFAAQPGNGASFGSPPGMNGAGYMSPQQQAAAGVGSPSFRLPNGQLVAMSPDGQLVAMSPDGQQPLVARRERPLINIRAVPPEERRQLFELALNKQKMFPEFCKGKREERREYHDAFMISQANEYQVVEDALNTGSVLLDSYAASYPLNPQSQQSHAAAAPNHPFEDIDPPPS